MSACQWMMRNFDWQLSPWTTNVGWHGPGEPLDATHEWSQQCAKKPPWVYSMTTYVHVYVAVV